jgi:uncharacterized protein
MTTVADVNVLFAMLVADHALHPAAWNWWRHQADGSVGLCLLTRMGTLRLLTNSVAMGGHPVSPARALAAWDSLAADPRCVWIEPASGLDACVRDLVKHRQTSPNLWTDAWLAALAVSHGYRLTSFDNGFRTFRLTNFEHLKP